MADRPCPEIVDGAGEALPFEDARFDVILYPGSLQYMPIARSLEEAVRVLRPDGRLAIVNGEIGAATRDFFASVGRGDLSLGGLREYLGMLLHPVLGRAISPCPRPVYPSVCWIRRRLARLGLRYDAELSGFSGEEFVYVADKPGATVA
jgi:SAM-dependent methyltransferase